MFSRQHRPSDSFSSRYGTSKATKVKKSFNAENISTGLARSQSVRSPKSNHTSPREQHHSPPIGSTLTSAIITICVGPEQRLFAGHEDVLNRSTYFQSALKAQFFESGTRRINLPDESPEVLSAVLEYLYKGDYTPKLMHNKKKDTWELEDAGNGECSVLHHLSKLPLLKDTLIYCSADLYGLEELKRIALRKQGLQSGVHIGTILASARWAYDHTPDTESSLRGHYLALIIRSRNNFKKSTTMQNEMEQGGRLFFDLFVAMCNHMNDLQTVRSPYAK